MTSTVSPRRFLAFVICVIGSLTAVHAQQDHSAEAIEFFERKVRPVLVERCYSCHSSNAKTVHGGLFVDSHRGLLTGGDSGPAITPGDPDASLLIRAIQFDRNEDFQMPPKGRLPDHEIAALTEWIRGGAVFPADHAQLAPENQSIDFAVAKEFWSFLPLRRQDVPEEQGSAWPREPMDRFILAAMHKAELEPSPAADCATLLRRLTFDLTGLPPTPQQVAEFLSDDSPRAYEKQVDRLLSSPQYGERWGRWWLDLVRYTDRTAKWLDSTGQAHLYRDWVVGAMNDDVPYDQFVRRQLATDYLSDTGPEDMPALGLLGLSPNYWKELMLPSEIIKVIVADEWEERVDTVSRTFLGLTVACARCHDHKFDAITMEDYYGLAGVFANCRIGERPVIAESLYTPVRAAKQQVQQWQKQIDDAKKLKPQPTEKIAQLTRQIEEIKQSTPFFDSPMAPAIIDESIDVQRKGEQPESGTKLVYHSQPRDLHLFIRGNPNRPGELVPRRFLTVLSPTSTPRSLDTGSGRYDLAQAITGEAAPLAARVLVNRIWLAHFGRGLVTTPSNFGQSGSRPSHPRLLDDLAARFVADGWSMKRLHREIVMSATYRQSSANSGTRFDLDPDNVWLSRMPRSRLTVEAWRDAMLMASGELNSVIGGPSLELSDPVNRRRTIYGTIHRREMSTMLLTHDFPDPTSHSPRRSVTTTSLQGLYALNGPLILAQAEKLAERLLRQDSWSDSKRIEEAYGLLFARLPSHRETELGMEFLHDSSDQQETVTWTQYIHVLLASNEFAFTN